MQIPKAHESYVQKETYYENQQSEIFLFKKQSAQYT